MRWPRGLRRGYAVARLLGLRVQIPKGAWLSPFCECCVLSDISATGLSLVQSSPTDCVSFTVCDQVQQ